METEIKKTHLSEFKSLIRMNELSFDPWAASMGAWFDCAAHLYEKGDCPREWEYRPGSMGNIIEQDSPYFELFNSLNAEQLEEIGQLLWRYSALLKRHGRDY